MSYLVSKLLEKREKTYALIIHDKNRMLLVPCKEFKEFLLVGNKPYPKPMKHYILDSKKVYVINEDKIDYKFDSELLKNFIKKQTLSSIFDSFRPKINVREMIGYFITAAIAGFYLRDTVEKISQWILEMSERVPPEAWNAISSSLTMITFAAIFFGFMYYIKRKSMKQE